MKQSYISTAFWDDDWIGTLDPSEKLFYLYLITNSNNNIIGLYKLPKRKICFDTGFSVETTNLLISRFESEYKKIIYTDDHVFLKNMVKNQALNSPKLVEGMRRLVADLNDKFKSLFILEISKQGLYSFFNTISIPDRYPIDTLSIPYGYSIDMVCIPSGQYKYKHKHKTEIETETKIEKQTNNNTEPDPANSVCFDDVVVNAVCCFSEGMSPETPRRLAKLSDLTEITSNWYIIRVLLNNGIKTDKIIEIYNKLSIVEIARLWFWAKIKATINPAGYFLKLYEEDPDEIPDELDRDIVKQLTELNEREPIVNEKQWRIFNKNKTKGRQDECS